MRHIPPPPLYRGLYSRLIHLLPQECDSRVTNLVYLLMGIFLAKKVQTGEIATKLPVRAKRMSVIRVQFGLHPWVAVPFIPHRCLALGVIAMRKLSYPLHAVARHPRDRFDWLSTG